MVTKSTDDETSRNFNSAGFVYKYYYLNIEVTISIYSILKKAG